MSWVAQLGQHSTPRMQVRSSPRRGIPHRGQKKGACMMAVSRSNPWDACTWLNPPASAVVADDELAAGDGRPQRARGPRSSHIARGGIQIPSCRPTSQANSFQPRALTTNQWIDPFPPVAGHHEHRPCVGPALRNRTGPNDRPRPRGTCDRSGAHWVSAEEVPDQRGSVDRVRVTADDELWVERGVAARPDVAAPDD